ncbi:aquaporin-10-like [Ylistrum balloti]|uniref:aquaporin-10-like n=1 Tax=Ylistrum balloti TaxID=509963 RepID=UPI002905C837|nr:aquaporin-10-like [Ylistrum balloti]
MLAKSIRREALAEFLGTFMLMALSDGANAQLVLSGGTQGSALSVHISQGIGVMMGVYISGGVSGGHINPAVTVAQAVRGRLAWTKVPFYLAGQYGGSFLASVLLYLVYNDALYHYDDGVRSTTGLTSTARIWATYPQTFLSVTNGMVDQIFGSAILLICVSALSDKNNLNPPSGLIPVCTGLLVFVINSTFCFNCGCAVNPARDLSPRLFTAMAGWGSQPFSYNGYSYFWIPVLGPHIGAVLGTVVYDLCIGFHWPDDDRENIDQNSVWIPRKYHNIKQKQSYKDKCGDLDHLLETSV